MSDASTDDEDVAYRIVASKVAEVTLESDSLPETPSMTEARARRKKRTTKRPRDFRMDIDPGRIPSSSRRPALEVGSALSRMEWEGADGIREEETELDSDSSISSRSSRGKEADDEQSDWVGDCFETNSVRSARDLLEPLSVERRLRFLKRPHQSSIQRKLERFARDPHSGNVLTIDAHAKSRDNTTSASFERLLNTHKLEVVKRSRGSVVIAKKGST